MHPALEQTDHRPWPVPSGPWTWRQRWQHLLFAHWAVPPEALRPHLPARVKLQKYDGTAWLGVVPFILARLAVRFLPPVPGLNTFAELNLRTYVEVDGVPGVWFLSLDASNRFAVWAANNVFNLPYHRADMTTEVSDDEVVFESRRVRSRVGCDVTYRPTGPVQRARPGSLLHWLTERYCVYAASGNGSLMRTEVHHAPWPLQSAEADVRSLDLGRPFGFELDRTPDLLHYSRGVPVVLWPGTKLTDGTSAGYPR